MDGVQIEISNFGGFVDTIVGLGSKTLLIVLDLTADGDGDGDLQIQPSAHRSTIKYLNAVENVDLVYIDSLKRLLVFLAKVQLDKMDQPVIAVWGLSSVYRNDPRINIVLSRLARMGRDRQRILVGESDSSCYETLAKWENNNAI